jgi:hypothetical protein
MQGRHVGWLAAVAVAVGLIVAEAAGAEEVTCADPGPVPRAHRVHCLRNLYRMPILGLRSFFPLCPGPTASMYAPDRFPHIPPSFQVLTSPCYYLAPEAMYGSPGTPH